MLGADARAALLGTRFADVRWLDQVDSTNRVVADLARQGAAEGLVVAADHQTAGRGRRGRSWEAPPATSLLVSALVRPGLPAELSPLVTVAAGVATSDACAEVARVRPLLKWPNDLVTAEAKLGGILCELLPGPTGTGDAVVVGLGLNVNWPRPPAGLDGAVALSELCGRDIDRAQLLVAFLRHLDRELGALSNVHGRGDLLRRYRPLSATIGRPVRMTQGARTLEGRAVDVSAHGHLVVDDARGIRHHVVSGDVDQVLGLTRVRDPGPAPPTRAGPRRPPE